jgi:hypothetical protein
MRKGIRTRLLLIFALGGALAVVAAGTATSLTVGGVQVDVPDTTLPELLPDTTLPDTTQIEPPTIGGDPTGGGSGGGGGGGGGETTSGGSTTTTGGGTTTTKRAGAAPGTGLFGKDRKKRKARRRGQRKAVEQPPIRNPDGTPTNANPGLTIAQFGAAPIGVPNFVIDSFEIPPFLLPIYQACGTEYGIPWEVLASINKIESGFGTNMGPSSAGAIGWMQFLPSSWEAFGLDANGDGRKDPYNPVDAICSAAHYLKLGGGSDDLYNAIFSYNHADWYVQEVLGYARAYGKLPSDLVGSLTGLTEGAHFPVAADASYADDLSAREALKRSAPGADDAYGDAAEVISSSPTRRGINIFAAEAAPVVAVNDGVIEKMGSTPRLGKFVVLQDAYGNRYTYAELGQIVREQRAVVMPTGKERRLPVDSENLRPRLRALPGRAESGDDNEAPEVDSPTTIEDGTLRVGSKVIAGTVLARIGSAEDGIDPHVNFSIRPAGRGAPEIDPKPILDGWKLLEATAIYRANGKNPLAQNLSGAGVLLLSKEQLQERVLADESLEIYECGRQDIATGQIDRRVLAMLEYLVSKGYKLTVTSLRCGHSILSASGYVSEHSTGDAVDIPVINGVPVTGHQGPGTLTDELIRTVLQLQGTMHPHQVISLEDLPGETSFALADHYDHVHIGYHPLSGPFDQQFNALLKPDQWQRLTNRLGEIDNPRVSPSPSPYSLPDSKGTSGGTAQPSAGD